MPGDDVKKRIRQLSFVNSALQKNSKEYSHYSKIEYYNKKKNLQISSKRLSTNDQGPQAE